MPRLTQATHEGTRGGIVVDGLDLLVSSFTREADQVRGRAEDLVVDYAAKAADRMRSTVAIGPPDVHVVDTITSDTHATKDGRAVYADAGPDEDAGEGAFVARFLEHGTVHMGPQPFVGPAADYITPGFDRDVHRLPRL